MKATLSYILEELIAATRCSGCDSYSELLCAKCLASFEDYDRAKSCPRCAAAFGLIACTECFDANFDFDEVLSLGDLEGVLRRSILMWKDRNEQRLAAVFGRMLAQRIRLIWGDWADQITYVPSTKAAFRRRGFSQSADLAARVAQLLGMKEEILVLKGELRDLRGLSKSERKQETERAYRLKEGVHIGERVLIIDDVLTTGATLNTLTRLLKEAGAGEVRVAVLARTTRSSIS